MTEFNRYYGESERTFIMGEPNERQKRLFKTVLEAQTEAIEAIGPGVEAQELDRITRKVFINAGYGEFVRHRTGHSMGLDQHEWGPSLLEGWTTPLEKGMVLTVEPGIYVPGVGGSRHSDTVVVTEDGYENFTNLPKDLESMVIH